MFFALTFIAWILVNVLIQLQKDAQTRRSWRLTVNSVTAFIGLFFWFLYGTYVITLGKEPLDSSFQLMGVIGLLSLFVVTIPDIIKTTRQRRAARSTTPAK